MSGVDQHAEAHRLKTEHGYGARRIAEQLGITRHAATLLLSQPLAEPVAEAAAGGGRPVAAVAATDGQERRPVAEVAEHPLQPRPLPQRMSGPLAGIDVSRSAALRRDMALLTQSGLSQEALVHQAVVALAYTYRQYLDRGELAVGQAFLISTMTLTPRSVARPAGRTDQAG